MMLRLQLGILLLALLGPYECATYDFYDFASPRQSSPVLTIADCNSREPCRECFGDCNSDGDCADGLQCYQRSRRSENDTTAIPGCSGNPGIPGIDYCIQPQDRLPLRETDCNPVTKCLRCFGDCDSDLDCAEGLSCFVRPPNDASPVPGCSGQGIDGLDYCYQPNLASATMIPTQIATVSETVAQTVPPATVAPTEAQTQAATAAATIASTEAQTQAVTTASTTASTVAPTEAQTQAFTMVETAASTETQTQAVTIVSTEAQTQAATAAATVAPTEAQTQSVTVAETLESTDAQTQAVTTADTVAPTETQTQAATAAETAASTEAQTQAVTEMATVLPTEAQTVSETTGSTVAPTEAETQQVTSAEAVDTAAPTETETQLVTADETSQDSDGTVMPTIVESEPLGAFTLPAQTAVPTEDATEGGTASDTVVPTVATTAASQGETIRVNIDIIYFIDVDVIFVVDNNGEPANMTPAPTGSSAEATSSQAGPGFYDDFAWEELPPEVQAAAKVLGYDPNTWDNGLPIPAVELFWAQLSPEQQEAAAVLGYDQESWDNAEAESTTAPTLTSTEEATAAETTAGATGVPTAGVQTTAPSDVLMGGVETIMMAATDAPTGGFYDDLSWDDLPPEARAAAEALGYDQMTWDNGIPIPVDDLFWADLTPEQQENAAVLGYDQETWDNSKRKKRKREKQNDSRSACKRQQRRRRVQEVTSPTDAEVDNLIENTCEFYVELFFDVYPDSLVDTMIPLTVPHGPLDDRQYQISITLDIAFLSVPPSEDVVETIEQADYEVYVTDYVHPSGPYFAQTDGVAVSPTIEGEAANGTMIPNDVELGSLPPMPPNDSSFPPETPIMSAETSDPATDPPLLDVEGCNDPFVPCARCMGDCDTDDDCENGLLCFLRPGIDGSPVPGCSGSGSPGTDYCFQPLGDTLRLSAVSCSAVSPCGICFGDCDTDSDCSPGLVCQERDGMEEMPGCLGSGIPGLDYCFAPPGSSRRLLRKRPKH
ncbi:CLECT [Seminavis robusta]|uniref:CLECT n=1 Tax=Seminavis robusta TaxID=568900 RepID=A0A9N8E935_9STRA|nr:CLECT [Seminavis robusta]|eukprot:Sro628_g178020.1 CLECT (1002) ;mRNA; r:13901-17661